MDIGLLWGTFGIFAGGILKGAVGAGAPVLGVPLLALIYDVPLAVATFTLPNLVSNIWQGWRWRSHQASPRLVWSFALAGALGAGLGSFLLAWLPGEALMAALGGIVFVYIGVRIAKPHWTLDRALAERIAWIAGLVGGMMQGAGGISAPVSVTFLNAMRLERGEFIATISVFFLAMTITQIPTLWALGILTPHRAALSALAIVPLFAGMGVGSWLARHVSREAFDKLILILLALVALRLIWGAVV